MRLIRDSHQSFEHRRGLTTPVVAIALLITMMGLALILDRIWLETAQLELTTAAEATALAAARRLASDDRLLPDFSPTDQLAAARSAAAMLSGGNLVAGQPPSFDATGSDLIFGTYSPAGDEGQIVLKADVDDPRTARVTLHRTRARNNPVALFISELTGVPFGNVLRQADATIDNHISGVRPVAGASAPALPIAIWQADPTGNRRDTWNVQIEQRRGTDQYRFDATSNMVAQGGDGIPEMTVRSRPRGGRPETCNVQILDLGTGLDDEKLPRQIQHGWTNEDLAAFGGGLDLTGGVDLTSTADLLAAERDALEALSGEPRICLLYSTAAPTSQSALSKTHCIDFVAIRIMAVDDQQDGSCILVLQPAVLATRAAVATAAVGQPPAHRPNKYVFNLKLTN